MNDNRFKKIVDLIFAQMTATKGIKLFGQRAVSALFKEYKQFYDMDVFERVKVDDLPQIAKNKALNAINLIKEKGNGDIKGRTCANGKMQEKYLNKEETSSPTVAVESLFMSLCIDSHEKRDVAIFDVPGAYLNAYMPDDKFLLIKFDSKFVDIMCEVNPELIEDVRFERGKKVLYLKIKKALYGCIESALLWYNLFLNKLTDLGFKVNPYDRCVANKIIDGQQCTIVWYVDDVKVSYTNKSVVSDVIKYMQEEFGNITVSRGNSHTYLGMDIEFLKNNSIYISMKRHMKELLNMLSGGVHGTTTSLAKKDMFNVDTKSRALDQKSVDLFHSVIAKIL